MKINRPLGEHHAQSAAFRLAPAAEMFTFSSQLPDLTLLTLFNLARLITRHSDCQRRKLTYPERLSSAKFPARSAPSGDHPVHSRFLEPDSTRKSLQRPTPTFFLLSQSASRKL
jgi:hypothetical protein